MTIADTKFIPFIEVHRTSGRQTTGFKWPAGGEEVQTGCALDKIFGFSRETYREISLFDCETLWDYRRVCSCHVACVRRKRKKKIKDTTRRITRFSELSNSGKPAVKVKISRDFERTSAGGRLAISGSRQTNSNLSYLPSRAESELSLLFEFTERLQSLGERHCAPHHRTTRVVSRIAARCGRSATVYSD